LSAEVQQQLSDINRLLLSVVSSSAAGQSPDRSLSVGSLPMPWHQSSPSKRSHPMGDMHTASPSKQICGQQLFDHHHQSSTITQPSSMQQQLQPSLQISLQPSSTVGFQ
jgi:hypothetical protein